MSDNQSPAQILRKRAELVARTGELLDAEIEQAAALLRKAIQQSSTISVCGNRISGALVVAAGFDYEVFLPPGRPGDVILAILPSAPSDDLVGVIEAAQARGVITIALLCASPSPLESADLILHVPTESSQTAALAMAAVLHTIYTLLEKERA